MRGGAWCRTSERLTRAGRRARATPGWRAAPAAPAPAAGTQSMARAGKRSSCGELADLVNGDPGATHFGLAARAESREGEQDADALAGSDLERLRTVERVREVQRPRV